MENHARLGGKPQQPERVAKDFEDEDEGMVPLGSLTSLDSQLSTDESFVLPTLEHAWMRQPAPPDQEPGDIELLQAASAATTAFFLPSDTSEDIVGSSLAARRGFKPSRFAVSVEPSAPAGVWDLIPADRAVSSPPLPSDVCRVGCRTFGTESDGRHLDTRCLVPAAFPPPSSEDTECDDDGQITCVAGLLSSDPSSSAYLARVGWFVQCRGCSQLTGGQYKVHDEIIPFCNACLQRLFMMPKGNRISCKRQLLQIHYAWSNSGH